MMDAVKTFDPGWFPRGNINAYWVVLAKHSKPDGLYFRAFSTWGLKP